jgi:hypothetical protein
MKANLLVTLAATQALIASALTAADLRQGLVSYWPLDVVSADGTTPDRAGANPMPLYNLDASSLVSGKRGQALSFDANWQQYAYLTTPAGTDTGLPISRAGSFSVALWVKGPAGQVDRRVFSESNSDGNNNNPLVNIGTHNAGTDGTVDLFFRDGAGAAQLNHLHSPGIAFDDQWHHLALVDVSGAVTLYIDGVQNMTASYTRAAFVSDTTSLGGIVRGGGGNIAALFTGAIDDVAVWERALTAAEVAEVMANGVQTPVPAFAPFVTLEPAGATNLLAGDSFTLRAGGGGTRPLSYQWLKGDTAIPGATEPTLTFTSLTAADTADYRLRISNNAGTVASASARLEVGQAQPPNLVSGVVSYWPLNEVQGGKTPDIVRGYDMELVNLTAADLKPGRWGNSFQFDLARQTMLTRINTEGDLLPIYQHPDFSVSLWVKGDIQSDKRVFSEGSTRTTQPLFNIGTHNTGADGTVDSYIRTDSGATSGDHRHSTGIAFDNAWHHILYVQREVGGVMQAVLYIDGVADDVVLGPVRPLSANTTTIGGILRATPAAWFTGQIDDVVVWNRALSAAEAQLLATTAMPTPPPVLKPLAISVFASSLPAVVQGDAALLRWDVSKDATQITLEPGVGDVTAQTSAGAGSVSVTPTGTTTYTLTVKRGTDVLTATRKVTVIDGVSANWTLLDNFDRYEPGFLSATEWWLDLRGNFARVEDQGGNRMLSMSSTDSAAVFRLGNLKITEGQQRTLFFRMMPRGQPVAALQHVLGLTDKNIRWHGDTTGNIGPALQPTFDLNNPGWFLGVINGVGGIVEFPADPLITNTVYAVWIDINNRPMNDPVSPYDVFSVYLRPEGATARTDVFREYLSDRDPYTADVVLGGMAPDLDKLFISGNNTTDTAWFDDFYVSKTGFNSTLPRPFGFSLPVGGEPPTLSINRAGDQLEVTWSAGTLESASTISGPWAPVTGATASPYRTSVSGTAMFFRARQ